MTVTSTNILPDRPYNGFEQPGLELEKIQSTNTSIYPNSQQLPAVPFYRRRDGIIVIILIIVIVIGAIVGGAVGGTRTLRLAAQRDGTTAGVQAISTNVTTSTTSVQVVSTTVTTSTTADVQVVSTTMTTSTTATFSAPSPSPSNCVWEGSAPFCDGKCHTGFTQIQEDNCGSGDCCWTGFKVYCCQQ